MDLEKRGTKRKYGEVESNDARARIRGKLHHSVKEVKKAAKKAKTFEIQKAIKKLKDLRKKDEQSASIPEAESCLQILKNMDHDLIGALALSTKLKKTKILNDSPAVEEAISHELPPSLAKPAPTAAIRKVQNRLLSSRVLAEEIHTVIEDLKTIVAPKPELTQETGSSSSKEAKQGKILADTTSSQTHESKPSRKDEEDDSAGQKDGSGKEEVLDDEVSDDGWESGTVDEEVDGVRWESESVVSEGELNVSVEAEEEDSDELPRKQKLAKVSKPARLASESLQKTPGASSTFLPSLSVGFIRGSDDSDFSDREANMVDPEIKKNRRGQRARRVIWEKKYGKNANHRKKEAAENQKATHPRHSHSNDRSHPYALKRARSGAGSTGVEDAVSDRGWAGRNDARHKSASSSIQVPMRSGAEKTLHPSWEAKKKQKEKAGLGILQSQGKKIVFS